jgi:5-methyltetrahydropteroyltriglutamate--homocysteine methyltransferase
MSLAPDLLTGGRRKRLSPSVTKPDVNGPSHARVDGHAYLQLASEKERARVLATIREHARPDQWIFVGVIDSLDPRVETAEEVKERVLEAAEYIPLARLGTTDDCGFAPFGDDTSTARETAFEKIRARVLGTQLAARQLEAYARPPRR